MSTHAIHHFTLLPGHLTTIELPRGAQLLHVGMRYSRITLWALRPLETTHPLQHETRTLRIVATGEELTAEELATLHYLGTVHQQHTPDMNFVWHVFEVKA